MSNQGLNAEVSGPGSLATSGGISSGEGGFSVGGNVLGNIIRAINVINIIGGAQSPNDEVLRDLGQQIKQALSEIPADSEALLQLIRAHVEPQLGEGPTVSVLDYLIIAGKTFGPLAEKYSFEEHNFDIFPFGDFLGDMISLMSSSEAIVTRCFDAFADQKKARYCKDVGALFTTPLKYETLELPEVAKTIQEKLIEFFPHQSAPLLLRRAESWAKQEIAIGEFYKLSNEWVVCPIRFTGRDLLAYQWRRPINATFFQLLTSSLLADFILYLHKLRTELSTAKRFIGTIQRLKPNRP